VQNQVTPGTEPHQIIVVDDLLPEDIAMLQALYSRDPRSVLTHLDRIKEAGAGKFMGQYYVGYGHKSIGDCGTTTLFIEQVSMLGAKAIQHWPLYSGQESSTRYLDFSNRKILDPIGTFGSGEIHTLWMNLYHKALKVLVPHLVEQYPITKDEDASEKTRAEYKKAINAKAFDIARSFLPAGMTTMASWHTNLRQANDHIKVMRHHPLSEMRKIAGEMLEALRVKYPNSFSHTTYPEDEAYLSMARGMIEYNDFDKSVSGPSCSAHFKQNVLDKYGPLLQMRPPKSELPHELRKAGDIDFIFELDFGSWRDLQRQRSMTYLMPLLTLHHGFEPWYLEQLPEKFRELAKDEIDIISSAIRKLDCDEPTRQYYIAMGFRVACDISCNLPSAVYIAELRSKQDVHPTLRPVAGWIAGSLREYIPGIKLYEDKGPDKWSIRRGAQDITKK